jgi:hypothetical protein
MKRRRLLLMTTLASLATNTVGCGDGASNRDGGSSAAADDGGTTLGDADDDSGDDGMEAFEPAGAVLPRLTRTQYRNAVTDLLGEGLPLVTVEADTNPYLFYSIGATINTLSEHGTQQYEEAADTLTRSVFGEEERRVALLGCVPQDGGDDCVEDFLVDFGRRAFRRPLTTAELTRWREVSSEITPGDPWEGVRLAVAGMLQSPHFLYRVELGETDPTETSRLRYSGYEMASRLAFLLLDSIPDDALLDAAESGELLTQTGLRAHAERLLDDPRSRIAVQRFFAQYFDLGRLGGVSRDPARYPGYTPSLPASMRTEIELLVDDVVYRRDVDVRGIYNARRTFVNDALAELYGVPAQGATPITFVPVELPEEGPRAGLLTLGAFLTMNAHETETSPTLRGKYLRERVLCQTVGAPPDDIDINLDAEGGEGKTLRERLEEHRNNPACASCHAFVDPPGYLFEHFDSLGAYRTLDAGYPIDATGDLDGAPLADARELADLLAVDPRVGRCVVTQLYRHANGRLETVPEQPAIDDLDRRFADAEYRFRDLLIELISHDSFRFVAKEEV